MTLKKSNTKTTGFKLMIMIAAVFFLFTMASCAPGANEFVNTAAAEEGEPAGFFLGLWHGFITLFTFIISLFNDKVNVYEVHNSGALYNLGFLLGVSIFFGGSGTAGGSRRHKDRD